jgi:hypothetical protein
MKFKVVLVEDKSCYIIKYRPWFRPFWKQLHLGALTKEEAERIVNYLVLPCNKGAINEIQGR